MNSLNGPNLERILTLGGQVVEPVPIDERGNFSHYRGLHLGAVCLNYFRKLPVLNAGGNPTAHFSSSYAYALSIARSQTATNLRHTRQFTLADAAELSNLSGVETRGLAFPSMVVALDPSLTGMLEAGDMEGDVYNGYLTALDVDPHSQAILQTIFSE